MIPTDELFFKHKAFYQITNMYKGLDTPEQRLTEDVEKVRLRSKKIGS